MALEAFSLPNGNIDRIDAITDASHNTGDYQLDTSRRRGLQDCAEDHYPAPPHDTPLAAEAVCRQKRNDGAHETSDVIYGGNDTFEIGTRIIEISAERRQADDGTQHSLVVTKQLQAKVLEIQKTTKYGKLMLTRNATPQTAAMAPLKADPARRVLNMSRNKLELCPRGAYRPRCDRKLPGKLKRSASAIFNRIVFDQILSGCRCQCFQVH